MEQFKKTTKSVKPPFIPIFAVNDIYQYGKNYYLILEINFERNDTNTGNKIKVYCFGDIEKKYVGYWGRFYQIHYIEDLREVNKRFKNGIYKNLSD